MLRASSGIATLAAFLFVSVVSAVEADRDFSGHWILDANASNMSPAPPAQMTVTQTDAVVECAAGDRTWSYALDRNERSAQFGSEAWSSIAKWEGSALLIDSLVSGSESYAVMDRWELSRNQALLVLTRQVVRGNSHSEAQFFYRRERAAATSTPPAALVRRPDVAPDSELIVPAGTHVLLELVNQLDTHHSNTGDRIYLRTAFPVYANSHLAIPQGATVLGTVTEVKKPGKASGKGQLYIRFDSLTLPNGVSRDFRSRLGSASGARGDVDTEEGKVTSPSNSAEQTRDAAQGAGMGAIIGSSVGLGTGHPIGGTGVGAAAGAAAGLGIALAKGKPDAVLPKGSNLEMILDRDLHYRLDELH